MPLDGTGDRRLAGVLLAVAPLRTILGLARPDAPTGLATLALTAFRAFGLLLLRGPMRLAGWRPG
jgi:hypothetical protein